jgi:hypothetical protein
MNNKYQASHSRADKLTDDELAMQSVLSKQLDAQVEDLDFNISSKLSAARHKALSGQSRNANKKFVFSELKWSSAALVCCAAVLVAFLTVQLNYSAPEAVSTQVAVNEPTHFIEDLNILSATDDIDFYQSVEFLEWMESNNAG